ncbi:hypothetical protein [Wukongibacter sp. M2B1]|uniref:hypothetical protein n=1 Tax=Wukongibacter sp. M2B1 TaxID=3088895 RepID=UPI003D79F4FD
MIKEVKYSECKFSFEFKGDEGIYVPTLKESIDGVINILKEITREQAPEAFVKLKITKFDTGSFDIDFLVILEQTKNLLGSGEEAAKHIVSILGNIFIVKQFLKGQSPEQIEDEADKVKIKNHTDEEMTVDKKVADTYFNNPKIDNMVINIFNVIDKEEDKTELIIKNEMNEQVRIPKKDFEDMKKQVVHERTNNNKVFSNTVETSLLIRKPDLTGKLKCTLSQGQFKKDYGEYKLFCVNG